MTRHPSAIKLRYGETNGCHYNISASVLARVRAAVEPARIVHGSFTSDQVSFGYTVCGLTPEQMVQVRASVQTFVADNAPDFVLKEMEEPGELTIQ